MAAIVHCVMPPMAHWRLQAISIDGAILRMRSLALCTSLEPRATAPDCWR